MAFDTVPPTGATTTSVITKAVDYTITVWAGRVGRHNRQTQAKLHHHPEQSGRNVKPEGLAGGRVEPCPCTIKLKKAEVGPGGLTVRSRTQELRNDHAVQRPGQLTLTSLRRHGNTQAISRRDILVVGSHSGKLSARRGCRREQGRRTGGQC